MDGVKIDKAYKKKNGLGPVHLDDKVVSMIEPSSHSEHEETVVEKTTRKKSAVPKKARQPLKIQSKVIVVIVIVILGLLAFGLFNFIEAGRLNGLLSTKQSQQGQSQIEIKNKELVDKIGLLMHLPDSEPEIRTVKDKSKLPNDPFYTYAENGDKVVVFPDETLMILFRESEGKIIDTSRNASLIE